MLSASGTRGRARTSRERGSIVVAVLVVMIMATLAAAMVARVTSESHGTVRDRDRAAALDAAETGLVVGQARVVAGADRDFIDDGEDAQIRWHVAASSLGADHWQLVGVGTSGKVSSTVRAELTVDGSGRWVRSRWREVSTDFGD